VKALYFSISPPPLTVCPQFLYSKTYNSKATKILQFGSQNEIIKKSQNM